MDIACRLETEREAVEALLDRWLPPEGEYPERIHEAIRYSALGGGKRLRPIIMLAAVRAVGGDPDLVVPSACAVEYVHCCSLVLDDLPSMDDAAMRRGKPTTHRVFGSATAILAADALLMHSFKLLAENGVSVDADGPTLASAVRELATAVGSYGMVGGQHVDLETAAHASIAPETLEYIQSRKTGALFVASARIGPLLLGAPPEMLADLETYARSLGLAYQIVDDILDAEGDVETLGKDVGRDADTRKKTFVTVHGVDEARRAARELAGAAERAIDGWSGTADPLREIAVYCVERTA
ncbi:MAG: hypothetical protein GF405_07815 [Candidatus Eisenbacteria bacterium]|nr:hypothetical protein [Candidatus Eisenbacteria bacterium]